uniref:Uncharacterized protein n=1 Tax=uncultured marine virus TaxID=186617 RepID=A0A0F7L5A1_9VIRU|nr:hypothetical protein [uncultured marine virus]
MTPDVRLHPTAPNARSGTPFNVAFATGLELHAGRILRRQIAERAAFIRIRRRSDRSRLIRPRVLIPLHMIEYANLLAR